MNNNNFLMNLSAIQIKIVPPDEFRIRTVPQCGRTICDFKGHLKLNSTLKYLTIFAAILQQFVGDLTFRKLVSIRGERMQRDHKRQRPRGHFQKM